MLIHDNSYIILILQRRLLLSCMTTKTRLLHLTTARSLPPASAMAPPKRLLPEPLARISPPEARKSSSTASFPTNAISHWNVMPTENAAMAAAALPPALISVPLPVPAGIVLPVPATDAVLFPTADSINLP